ncbi:LrgB family protein [Mesobacillus foraminis]|uniref:Putative effector of murein hydrolase n=1 Tax=Mesobacillus foraminis TaxID=279826 RepID=A0A4R2ATG4_9BACI|nr:LrgB family protein [Mesobacillus foraminis]TCN16915.1 putative effector of murein hydrolase [Mesobacillus foraminis]
MMPLLIMLCIAITIGSYLFSLTLYKKYKKPWLNPLYTASALLIAVIFAFHIQADAYLQASSVFNQLLQLAVVSLAVPLYKQLSYLKKNYKKIIAGVIMGTALGLAAVIAMSHIFHLQEQLLASLIPRSVTLPIALIISSDLGGISSTTIFFVITSALISLIVGPKTLYLLGINSKSAKGLAMGTSAQMLGANRSFAWGKEEGAMGNIAVTTSAIFLSLLVPILTLLF